MFLIDTVVVLGFSVILSLALLVNYLPKINKIKKGYEEFNIKMRDKLNEMTETERSQFLSSMSGDSRDFFNDILNNNNSFHGVEQFYAMHEQIQHTQDLHVDSFNDFSKWAMDESTKAVTPFDHGGYVQGDGFNPSDTMAHQMNNDMNNMNDSFNNHMDMGGGGSGFDGF